MLTASLTLGPLLTICWWNLWLHTPTLLLGTAPCPHLDIQHLLDKILSHRKTIWCFVCMSFPHCQDLLQQPTLRSFSLILFSVWCSPSDNKALILSHRDASKLTRHSKVLKSSICLAYISYIWQKDEFEEKQNYPGLGREHYRHCDIREERNSITQNPEQAQSEAKTPEKLQRAISNWRSYIKLIWWKMNY